MSETLNIWRLHMSNLFASLIICLPVAFVVFVFSDLSIINQIYYYLVASKSMSFGMTISDTVNGK